MSTFVLVHGAWHGGWCYEEVVPRLAKLGHRAIAPDLPGHGSLAAVPAAQVTLAAYALRVAEAVRAQPEPVVLVGHSMGGATITAAAELVPERVRTLVYLCAFLLRDGESILSAGLGPESLILPAIVPSADGLTSTIRPDAIRACFYAQCSDADVARATARLVPQSAEPSRAPVHWTPERVGRIPRVYVECLRDQAIPLASQRRMQANLPCVKTLALDTDHSPFYSCPDELAAALAAL